MTHLDRKHHYKQENFTYDDIFNTIKSFESHHPFKMYTIVVHPCLEDGEEFYISSVHTYNPPKEGNKDTIIDYSHQLFEIIKDMFIHDRVKRTDTAVIWSEEGNAYNVTKILDITTNTTTFWKDEYEYDGVRDRFVHNDESVIMKFICKPVEQGEA